MDADPRLLDERHAERLQSGDGDAVAHATANAHLLARGADGAHVVFAGLAHAPATAATRALLAALVQEHVLPVFQAALASPHASVREAAVHALVHALRDPQSRVRAAVAEALGAHGGETVLDAVLDLAHDPDASTRRYALDLLHRVPDARALPTLLAALDDPDWWVRERAVDALGRMGRPEAIEPLARLIARDPRSAVAGARALGMIAHPTCAPALVRLMGAADASARHEAVAALRRLASTPLDDITARIVRDALASAPRLTTITPSLLRRHARTPVAAGRPVTGPRTLDTRNLAPGTVLGERFRIVATLGSGGFGTVYRATDLQVAEDVVLKLLAPQLASDAESRQRFVRELRLARRISHPNVIRIHDLLELDGATAISMEWFDGRDLGRVLHEDGPIPAARVHTIAAQALEGLAAAHEVGVLHRDLKPGNLLVGEGDAVRIVDFGLAAVVADDGARLTRSGMMVGTPEYISPEQIRGETMDGRSDLYSLAVVLYEALTGRAPFQGASPAHVIYQHLEGAVPPPDLVQPGIPSAFASWVMHAMARDPEHRPADASAMLETMPRVERWAA